MAPGSRPDEFYLPLLMAGKIFHLSISGWWFGTAAVAQIPFQRCGGPGQPRVEQF